MEKAVAHAKFAYTWLQHNRKHFTDKVTAPPLATASDETVADILAQVKEGVPLSHFDDELNFTFHCDSDLLKFRRMLCTGLRLMLQLRCSNGGGNNYL